MFKNLLGAVALIVGFGAAPAFAADLIVLDDQLTSPAPATSWEGFYVGGFVGYHAGTVIEYVCAGLCSGNFPLTGLIGGLQAGYDFQYDQNWVFGGFVQVPLLKPTGSATIGAGVATFTVEPQFAVTGGVRVGYAVDQFLPYAFAGVAVVGNKVTSSFGPAPTATHVGLSAGVGVEYKLTENVSIDGRYTYTGLNAATYDWGGGPEQYGENSSNFTLGVNYRF